MFCILAICAPCRAVLQCWLSGWQLQTCVDVYHGQWYCIHHQLPLSISGMSLYCIVYYIKHQLNLCSVEDMTLLHAYSAMTIQEGSCQSQEMEVAASMQYYQLVEQGSEDAVMRAVADNGPTVVSIDHQTRSFMVRTHTYTHSIPPSHFSSLQLQFLGIPISDLMYARALYNSPLTLYISQQLSTHLIIHDQIHQ